MVNMLRDGAEAIGREDVSTEEIYYFIKMVDRNNDGKISKRELIAFLRVFV